MPRFSWNASAIRIGAIGTNGESRSDLLVRLR
jgi:hypothetical protein